MSYFMFLRLALLIYCAILVQSIWIAKMPPSTKWSVGFTSTTLPYTCASVKCNENLYKSTYFHLVFGAEHLSSFPMLVYRMCEGLQMCIDPKRFLLVIHHAKSSPKTEESESTIRNSIELLATFGISLPLDDRLFTSNNKMMISLSTLYGVYGKNTVIYHSDLDELPDRTELDLAMKELLNDECDAIRGQWRERIAADGRPHELLIDSEYSIDKQYPYSCNISAQFMPERTTWKILVYRSNYRLVSGQHDVWCNKEMKDNSTWNGAVVCRQHLGARVDQSSTMKDIMLLIPRPQARPRMCKTTVTVNHYKFVSGVVQTLQKRAESYRNLTIGWWTQSQNIANHIRANFGAVCVNCPEFDCQRVD